MTENRLFSQAIVTVLGLLVFAATTDYSQTQNKVIVWSKSPIGSHNETTPPDVKLFPQIDGVEIEEIAVGGKSRIVGEGFAADDDWLKTITVRVKNISSQRLISVQITLVLPEMGQSPDIPLCYGCAAAEKEKGIVPGESVELKMLGGGFYDWLRSRIAENGAVSRITKAEIHHVYVTLPAGPTWFSGCIKTANLKNACPHNTP